jgi:putative ABC transport system permease protein
MFWKKISTVVRNLTANKKRSFFAMLGVAIGVAAVVSLLSLGQGTQVEVMKQIEQMGANLLVISPARINVNDPRKRGATAETLTARDAEEIIEQLHGVNHAVPVQSRSLQVKYGTKVLTTNIVGTLPEYQDARNFWPETGRFFQNDEVAGTQRVAVLGRLVAERLFEDTDPIGEKIRINNLLFTVVGVMQSKGVDATGQDQDDQIFIPLTTAGRRILNQEYLNNIYVQVKDGRLQEAEEEINDLLGELHKIRNDAAPDFTIQDQADVLLATSEVDATFKVLMFSIALVSLLVGGIGILAIMLMTVKERTWEIGLRRAIGARQRDILWQFVLESFLLSLGGGVIGVIMGIAGGYLISRFTGWQAVVTFTIIFLACSFAGAVGLVFGIFPAQKAAKLSPIEALRSE